MSVNIIYGSKGRHSTVGSRGSQLSYSLRPAVSRRKNAFGLCAAVFPCGNIPLAVQVHLIPEGLIVRSLPDSHEESVHLNSSFLTILVYDQYSRKTGSIAFQCFDGRI